MKVTMAGKNYYVGWEYSHDPGCDHPAHNVSDETRCVIKLADEPRRRVDWEVVAVGVAKRYHKDPHNKDAARRASLARALDNFVYGSTQPRTGRTEAEAATRKIFWDVYLNRKGAKK